MTACAWCDIVQPEERFGFIKRAAQRGLLPSGSTRQHDAGTFTSTKIGVVEALSSETCGALNRPCASR
jgi:hypothetical protein